jgi:predicted RNase H-like HicB family nuclease
MTVKHKGGNAESRPRYSMLIEWSNRDNQYVVSFPEWEAAGWSGHTGAKTYEAAAKRGRNMIENYIMWCQEDGKPLPEPALFDTRFYTDDDEDEAEDAITAATAQGKPA